MEKLKLTDIVPNYSVEDGEVEQAIDKLQGAETEDQFVNVIPLFLTCAVYSTWKQIGEEKKKDVAKSRNCASDQGTLWMFWLTCANPS